MDNGRGVIFADGIGGSTNMNWKTKSLIQRCCAALPVGREAAYYFLQRNFGELRNPPNPMPMLETAVDIFVELEAAGVPVAGRRVMEVGTGRRIEMPLAFFLAGASSVKTVDLNCYLRPELVMESTLRIVENRAEIIRCFSPIADTVALNLRIDTLANVRDFNDLLSKTNIEYHAPADATNTGFPSGSIDLQFSFTVFEHIPRDVLKGILIEFNRLASHNAIACHHVDLSDHFSHSDKSISMINFLQFEESDWKTFNDNQFAYHNRMRVTEYESLYKDVKHELVRWTNYCDERSKAELKNGFHLAKQFQGIDPEVLTTTAIRVFSKASK